MPVYILELWGEKWSKKKIGYLFIKVLVISSSPWLYKILFDNNMTNLLQKRTQKTFIIGE